jgi:hypothetical protein
MNLYDGLAVASSVLYYTLFPVYYILLLLVRLILILLSPVIYLGYVFKEVTMMPVRFLAHFEVSSSPLHLTQSTEVRNRHCGISLAQQSL